MRQSILVSYILTRDALRGEAGLAWRLVWITDPSYILYPSRRFKAQIWSDHNSQLVTSSGWTQYCPSKLTSFALKWYDTSTRGDQASKQGSQRNTAHWAVRVPQILNKDLIVTHERVWVSLWYFAARHMVQPSPDCLALSKTIMLIILTLVSPLLVRLETVTKGKIAPRIVSGSICDL